MRTYAAPSFLCVVLAACGGGSATSNGASTAPAPAPRHPALNDCGGAWSGVGVQESGSWTVELTLLPPDGLGPCGTIEYPSLGCGGEVLDCVAGPDGRVSMRERYTHDLERCAPAGQISVLCGQLGTPSEGRMAWTWSGEGGPVTTELTRR